MSQSETVDAGWSEVQNQLQRRNDLIPNLVNTVKGFAAQEQNVLVRVTEARSRVAGAGTPAETMEASNQLSSALSRLLVVVEKYPELKSDRNFIQLQDELAGTENRLAVARNRYNDAVREYNTTAKRFPTLLIAKLFGFSEKTYFEAPETATRGPARAVLSARSAQRAEGERACAARWLCSAAARGRLQWPRATTRLPFASTAGAGAASAACCERFGTGCGPGSRAR